MSSEVAASQIRDTIRRLQSPIPDLQTLQALLAAAALVAPGPRARAAAMLGALVLAPVILGFHIADSDQVKPLRDHPSLAAAAAVGAVVATLTARRLADPLQQVAGRAARLGAGDFRPAPHRHGIPELDRVSDVLDSSATALAELLQRSSRGDEAAFAAVYDATSSRAYGLALRVVRNPAQAEEVVQEAYLDAWRSSSRSSMTRDIRCEARPIAVSEACASSPISTSPVCSISRWPRTVVSGLLSSWETVAMSWLL